MCEFPVGAMTLLGSVPIMIGFVGRMFYFVHRLFRFFRAFIAPVDAFRRESAPQFVRASCPWFRASCAGLHYPHVTSQIDATLRE